MSDDKSRGRGVEFLSEFDLVAMAREELAAALRERDEARSEVRRTYNEMRDVMRERDEARAELLSATQQLELEREASAQLRAELGERMRETAEAQREACAEAMKPVLRSMLSRGQAADLCRATPLVTEGDQ